MSNIYAFTDEPGKSDRSLLLQKVGQRKYMLHVFCTDSRGVHTVDVSLNTALSSTEKSAKFITLPGGVSRTLFNVMASHNSHSIKTTKTGMKNGAFKRLDVTSDWPKTIGVPYHISRNSAHSIDQLLAMRAALWMRYVTSDTGMRSSDSMSTQQCFTFWTLDPGSYIPALDDDDGDTMDQAMLSVRGMYPPNCLTSGDGVWGTVEATDMVWRGTRPAEWTTAKWRFNSTALPYYAHMWTKERRATMFGTRRIDIDDRALKRSIYNSKLFGDTNAKSLLYAPILDGIHGIPSNPFLRLAEMQMKVQLKTTASYFGSCVHALVTLYAMEHIHSCYPNSGIGTIGSPEQKDNMEIIQLLTSTTAEYPRICKASAMACTINMFNLYVDSKKDIRWIGSDLPLFTPGALLKKRNAFNFFGSYADIAFMFGDTCIVVELKTHWTIPLTGCTKSFADMKSRRKAELDKNMSQLMAQAVTLRWAYSNCNTLWPQGVATARPMTVHLAVINIPRDKQRPDAVYITSASQSLPPGDDEMTKLTNAMIASVLHNVQTKTHGYTGHLYFVPKQSILMTWVIAELLAHRRVVATRATCHPNGLWNIWRYDAPTQRAHAMQLSKSTHAEEWLIVFDENKEEKKVLRPFYDGDVPAWFVPISFKGDIVYTVCSQTAGAHDMKTVAYVKKTLKAKFKLDAKVSYNRTTSSYTVTKSGMHQKEKYTRKIKDTLILLLPADIQDGEPSQSEYIAYTLPHGGSTRSHFEGVWKTMFAEDSPAFLKSLTNNSLTSLADLELPISPSMLLESRVLSNIKLWQAAALSIFPDVIARKLWPFWISSRHTNDQGGHMMIDQQNNIYIMPTNIQYVRSGRLSAGFNTMKNVIEALLQKKGSTQTYNLVPVVLVQRRNGNTLLRRRLNKFTFDIITRQNFEKLYGAMPGGALTNTNCAILPDATEGDVTIGEIKTTPEYACTFMTRRHRPQFHTHFENQVGRPQAFVGT